MYCTILLVEYCLHCSAQYCTARHCTVLQSIVLYCTVWHWPLLCTVSHDTVLNRTELYSTALRCTFCIVLHSPMLLHLMQCTALAYSVVAPLYCSVQYSWSCFIASTPSLVYRPVYISLTTVLLYCAIVRRHRYDTH